MSQEIPIIFNLNEERIEKLVMQSSSFVADIGLADEMMDEVGANAHCREQNRQQKSDRENPNAHIPNDYLLSIFILNFSYP